MRLFHGTIYDFDAFNDFAHFGTEKAALQAIIKQIDSYMSDRKRQFRHSSLSLGKPRIIEVDLDIDTVPSAGRDRGSFNKLALANALDDLCGHIGRPHTGPIYERFADEHFATKRSRDIADRDLYCDLADIKAAFLDQAITAFSYTNNVEDAGSSSICVVCPKKCGIKVRNTRLVSMEELTANLAGTVYNHPARRVSRTFSQAYREIYP